MTRLHKLIHRPCRKQLLQVAGAKLHQLVANFVCGIELRCNAESGDNSLWVHHYERPLSHLIIWFIFIVEILIIDTLILLFQNVKQVKTCYN